jgi:hypothetical protein
MGCVLGLACGCSGAAPDFRFFAPGWRYAPTQCVGRKLLKGHWRNPVKRWKGPAPDYGRKEVVHARMSGTAGGQRT